MSETDMMDSSISRKEFMVAFQPLEKNGRFTAVLILSSYVASIFASIYVGQWLLDIGGIAAIIGVIILALFIGTRLRGLNNIIHECTHRSFTKDRADNVVFGSLSAALVFNTFDAYQKEHVSHHVNRGNYELDLDFHHRMSFGIHQPLSNAVITRHIITPMIGLHLYRYFRPNFSATDGKAYLALKLAIVAAFVIYAWFDPIAAIVLVLVPYAWVYTSINYWTDCIDHGGILTHEDEIDASRNFVVPKIIRLFLFPRNNCFHLLHHLFPSVPSQHFDNCHKVLLNDPAYSEVH